MIKLANLSRQLEPLRTRVLDAVSRVLDSGVWISGPEVEAFESAVARRLDARHAVGVANGTDAIELALRAIDVRDQPVVTTAFSFAGTATAIRNAGGIPVFVDIDPSTCLIDVPRAAELIRTCRPRAVVPVHLFGRVVDVEELRRTCDAVGTLVVEDAAQAFDARLCGRAAGTLGHLGCFSFYPTKNLGAAGDAGMVTTQDAELADRIRRLRETLVRESHLPGARNSRLDAIQAAILHARLEFIDEENAARRQLAARYRDALGDLADLALPPEENESIIHQFVVRTPRRDALQEHLKNAGIETRIHYPRTLPEYLNLPVPHDAFPEAFRASREVLSIPIDPTLTEAEFATIIEAIRGYFVGLPAIRSDTTPPDQRPADTTRSNRPLHCSGEVPGRCACATCVHSSRPTPSAFAPRARPSDKRNVRRWSVGVTTAPRTTRTLETTLESLRRAGWDDVRLFCEPGVDPEPAWSHLPISRRDSQLGAFPNWFLALSELVMRDPRADAYVLFQDDILLAEGLREHLESSLWPAPDVGVVSLYCPSHDHAAGTAGFVEVDHGWSAWGALAYAFPNPSARAFLADPIPIDHRHRGPGDGLRNIDSVVGLWCRERKFRYFVHVPSLVQHIGETSTLYPRAAARGRRRAREFVPRIDPLLLK